MMLQSYAERSMPARNLVRIWYARTQMVRVLEYLTFCNALDASQ